MTPRSWLVVLILASGISISTVLFTIALLWAVVRGGVAEADISLSQNATQILLAWGGGILSIISGVVGYHVGKDREARRDLT